MHYYCTRRIIYTSLTVVGHTTILMKISSLTYYRAIKKKNLLSNRPPWMLIGYFDLISKIEIDRKNILNPKMCANPFILEIYSYIVERSFYWAPVLYACKYIPIQVLSIGLSICRCCCTISQCNYL